MDFPNMNEKAILEELGARIQKRRLARNISQIELVKKAGVARKVIQNLEGGQGCTLKGLIRTMRALDLLSQLDNFLPEAGPSPLELARLKGQVRQRASSPRQGKTDPEQKGGML